MTGIAFRSKPPETIPALPVVVSRLVALCARDDYSSAELVRLLEADPGIAARLVRLANSAYYGLSRQISAVERAVALLGKTTVLAVALGTTILRAWRAGTMPGQAEQLWVHAYLCGEGCRHLANRLPAGLGRSHADTLFLVGLLHDLGKILFLIQDSEIYAKALADAGSPDALRSYERERFGQDHADIGGDALGAWDFPPAVAAVVRFHHKGGLRAELRPDWEVLKAVDALLRGEAPPISEVSLPDALLVEESDYLQRERPEAEAFYRAIS